MSKRDLPPGLRARQQASGNKYFYLATSEMEKELPLGSDYDVALVMWKEHALRNLRSKPVTQICGLLDIFRLVELPTRDRRQRPALGKQLVELRAFFFQNSDPELSAEWPEPETYFDSRGSHCELRASAEIRLVGHVWRWAQKLSLIDMQRKCPWTSESAQTRIRLGIDQEVGEAILSIATLRRSPSGKHSDDAMPMPIPPSPNNGVVRPIATSSAERAATLAWLAAQTITDVAATEFLLELVRQLKMDGRPDLAREAQRLSTIQLHAVFKLMLEKPATIREGKLLLGTCRSARLDAFRATKRAGK
jgi:hypothetical protein